MRTRTPNQPKVTLNFRHACAEPSKVLGRRRDHTQTCFRMACKQRGMQLQLLSMLVLASGPAPIVDDTRKGLQRACSHRALISTCAS